jgi:hypothetical protein
MQEYSSVQSARLHDKEVDAIIIVIKTKIILFM